MGLCTLSRKFLCLQILIWGFFISIYKNEKKNGNKNKRKFYVPLVTLSYESYCITSAYN